MNKAGPYFAGREFSETEMEPIKEIVRMYPHLSRSELAATICQAIHMYPLKKDFRTYLN